MYRRMCTLKIFANKIQREERGLVKNTTATTTAKMSTWKAKTIEMCKLILIHSFMYMLMLKFSFFSSLSPHSLLFIRFEQDCVCLIFHYVYEVERGKSPLHIAFNNSVFVMLSILNVYVHCTTYEYCVIVCAIVFVFVSLFEQVCRGKSLFEKNIRICVKPDVPWSIPPTAILHSNSSRFSARSAQKSRFAVETWTPKSIYRIHRLYIWWWSVLCVRVYKVWQYARQNTHNQHAHTRTRIKKNFFH